MSDSEPPPTPVPSSREDRLALGAEMRALAVEVSRLSDKLETLDKKDRTSGIVVLVVSLVLQIAASNVWRLGYVGR